MTETMTLPRYLLPQTGGSEGAVDAAYARRMYDRLADTHSEYDTDVDGEPLLTFEEWDKLNDWVEENAD